MSEDSIASSLRSLTRCIGITVAFGALLVLYGWQADIVALKSLLPLWIPMAPATALNFLMAGVALVCLTFAGPLSRGEHPWARYTAQTLSVFITGFGVVCLGNFARLWALPVDFLWFDVEHPAPGQPTPARLAFATAFGLAVLGATIFLIARAPYSKAVEVSPFLLAIIGWLGLGSYFYGGEPLLPISGMAAHTALTFLLLSVGIAFARSDSKLVSLFLSETTGGTLARILIPPVVLIPVVFDVLRSAGIRGGWFSAGAGQSLFGLLTATFFGVLIWLLANRLRRTELEHRELARERARLEEIVDSSDEAIIMKRLDGTITFWNEGAEQMYGYSKREAIGSSIYMIVPAELRTEEEHTLKILARGERVEHRETERLHKDGTRVPLWAKISPIRDQDGAIIGAYATGRDLKKLKLAQAEGEALRTQYQQAQKMDSIGRLAGGIAHDFNNLLTVINGYSEMALNELDEGAPLRGEINEILMAGGGAAALTQQLLLFTSEQVTNREAINLNDVVADLERMLRRLIGENIKVTMNLAADLGNVFADSSQMTQVLMNLAVNARDAMPLGGQLTIETCNSELDESYAGHHLSVQPGPYVQLSVSDTGTGMDEETRQKIFEPFFTTKGRGKGTGLGLSTVYGIVKSCNGSVWVYSELNKGTVFKIYLPRTSEATMVAHAAAPVDTHFGDETVVLIEDEEQVRELAARILRSAGYDLHIFENGGSALEFLNSFDGKVDLIVTDVVMPGVTGTVLAEAVRIARPGLKIVYMSGYTDDTVFTHGVLDFSPYFVSKPFSRSALLEIVRRALD